MNQKTSQREKFETCVLRTAEFAFIKPYTNSEVNQEYHKNTIFNNFNHLLTKTEIFMSFTGLEYISISI